MSVNNSSKKVEGIVMEALPATTFRIKFQDGVEILGYLSGKMRLNHIKILPGDRVIVEMSPYDAKRGRIIRRN